MIPRQVPMIFISAMKPVLVLNIKRESMRVTTPLKQMVLLISIKSRQMNLRPVIS